MESVMGRVWWVHHIVDFNFQHETDVHLLSKVFHFALYYFSSVINKSAENAICDCVFAATLSVCGSFDCNSKNNDVLAKFYQ